MSDSHDADGGSPGPEATAGRVRDEQLLIDYALGRSDGAAAEDVRRRLAEDADFAALHADVANTLEALGTWPAPDPPEDLVEQTLERVGAVRRTEMLLAAQPEGAEPRPPVFSFRELVAIAAAVVLAVGILIPSLRRARQLADRGLCAANMGQIGAALQHYAGGNDDLLPATPAEAEWWLPRPGKQVSSNTEGLFLLIRHGYAQPEAFQCPATGEDAFVIRPGMRDFPSRRAVNYSYQHSINARMRYSELHARLVILSDDNPVFAGGRFHPERVDCTVSDNHGGGGQNVLYPGGDVVWATHNRVGVDGNNIFLAEGILDYLGREKPTSPTDSFVIPNPGR